MARGIDTKCIHLEEDEGQCSHYGALSYPIYQTATYAHPGVGQSTGFDYSRLQNPTREHLEKMVAALENGIDAFALSSGMAAISLLMEMFRQGDHIIADSDLYGGSIRLFHNVNEKNGVEFSSIDCCRDDVESYVKENTKAMPEVVYTVEEYAENPQVLGVSEDIIRTAFAKAGIREATQSTAKKLVDTFRKKEV